MPGHNKLHLGMPLLATRGSKRRKSKARCQDDQGGENARAHQRISEAVAMHIRDNQKIDQVKSPTEQAITAPVMPPVTRA